MREWTPSREELAEDWYRANILSREVEPVECLARIAYHDSDQEAVKVITPAPRFIGILMAGGYVRHVRVAREEDGAPVYEGTGEIMPAMSYDEAVAFVAWKDMPRGVNHFQILTTDDLPRIGGSIDNARKFRAAWRLKEAV
jgi:hypothetical protein